jgi:hypothetical protein
LVEEQLQGDEDLLKRIIAAKGPVVASIHIGEDMFTYGGGGLS